MNTANFFLGEKSLAKIEWLLWQNSLQKNAQLFLRDVLIESAIFGFAAVALASFFGFAEIFLAPIFAGSAIVLPIVRFALLAYGAEKRKKEIDTQMPDVLLQASVFPRGSDFLQIIAYIANAGYGAISHEFAKAMAEIEKGQPVELALQNIANRNESRILRRSISLLISGYHSGADMSKTFREAAEDMLETSAILRESAASLVVVKYTLMLAGMFIVPLILGLLLKLVASLDFSAFESLGFGLSAEARKETLSAILLGNQVYLAEYALIASVFIALVNNRPKKVVIYALIMLPVSFAIFFLAKGFG